MLKLRLSTEDDVFTLAKTLRSDDINEIMAATGSTPVAALYAGLVQSELCRTIADENSDEPVAMFGVTNIGPHHAVWMLASENINKHKTDFLRKSRTVVDWLINRYGSLVNIVDERNTLHHRWLEWCGFNIRRSTWCTLFDGVTRFFPFQRTK